MAAKFTADLVGFAIIVAVGVVGAGALLGRGLRSAQRPE
jgi:hypothetical protein